MATVADNSQFIYRRLLTQMTVRRGIGETGVGPKLAPLVSHPFITGQYFKRDRQRPGHQSLRRAPGEDVKRIQASKGRMDAFVMTDRSVIKPVPEEYVDGMPNQEVFQEYENAANEAVNEISNEHERDVHDLLWSSTEAGFNSIYGSAQVNTPGTKWNASGATIRDDVRTEIKRVYKRCGYRANTLLLTDEIFDAIASDPENEIGERIKYTNGQVPDTQLMARYFGVERVVVPWVLKDDANPGKSEDFDFLWDGDNAGIFYIDPSNTRNKDTLASTFYRTTSRKPWLGVFTKYNEDNESYEAKVHASYDTKMVDKACGSILWDVLT